MTFATKRPLTGRIGFLHGRVATRMTSSPGFYGFTEHAASRPRTSGRCSGFVPTGTTRWHGDGSLGDDCADDRLDVHVVAGCSRRRGCRVMDWFSRVVEIEEVVSRTSTPVRFSAWAHKSWVITKTCAFRHFPLSRKYQRKYAEIQSSS